MEGKWICIRFDNRRLWTADLCEGDEAVANLGGSYPGCRSTTIDARNTWGYDLEVKILPEGLPSTIEIKGIVE
jgi:hypothetical protein